VAPIVAGRADIVIADRQVHLVEHFSWLKIMLQKVGSKIVIWPLYQFARRGERVPGVLARQPDAAEHDHPVQLLHGDDHSGGQQELKIDSIPVVTNEKTRESRLFTSMFQHVRMSAGAIIRAYIMYKPTSSSRCWQPCSASPGSSRSRAGACSK